MPDEHSALSQMGATFAERKAAREKADKKASAREAKVVTSEDDDSKLITSRRAQGKKN